MRICSECDTPLGSRDVTAKTCSNACRLKRYRRKRREAPTNYPCGHPRTDENTYVRPDNGSGRCWVCKRANKAKYAKKKPPHEGPCAHCGGAFVGRWGAKYCSNKCSSRAAYLRKLGPNTNTCDVCEAPLVRRDARCCSKPSCQSLVQRLKIYGITLDDYKRMSAACAGCGSKESLCIDHCHASGKVRGVLCQACNKSLGLLDDRVSTLKALIAYLEGVSVASVSRDGA